MVTSTNTDIFIRKNIGAIFLGYDAFLQSEVLNIIKFIESKGFDIVSAKIRTELSKSEIENMFLSDNVHIDKTFKWWMVNELVSSGPMACIIIHKNNKNSCLYELNKIKGSGDPYKNSQETIRGRFKAINIGMNLIHIPDNYEQLKKDIEPFFNMDQLYKEIYEKKIIDKKHSFNALSQTENFELDFYSNKVNKDFSFFKSLYYLKYEILKSIKKDSEYRKQLQNLCIEYINNIRMTRDDNLKMMRKYFVLEQEVTEKYINKIKKDIILDELNDIILLRDLELLSLFSVLSNEEKFDDFNEEDIRKLKGYGIKISAMHEYILITSLQLWRISNVGRKIYE